jgi:hypothetical protein
VCSNDYAVLKDAEIDAVVSRSLTQAQKEMIKRYWLIGSVTFVIFVFCTTISLWHFFNLSPWQPLVAMMVTGPLAYVAVRYALGAENITRPKTHLTVFFDFTTILY